MFTNVNYKTDGQGCFTTEKYNTELEHINRINDTVSGADTYWMTTKYGSVIS